jgi:hypothetical protein
VRGEICAICCGTEREVTVSCPLDCEYLQEARRRERPAEIDPSQLPNRDIEVTEKLIAENEGLLTFLAGRLTQTALESGAVDADVLEALDALARTFRTLQSGVYYESRPAGSYAAGIYAVLQEGIQEFRAEEQRRTGVTHTRDAAVLGLIVFLQRIALDRNNGRPKGRAFIDSMYRHYQELESAAGERPERSSLILP